MHVVHTGLPAATDASTVMSTGAAQATARARADLLECASPGDAHGARVVFHAAPPSAGRLFPVITLRLVTSGPIGNPLYLSHCSSRMAGALSPAVS
jgi:hypothetical protein